MVGFPKRRQLQPYDKFLQRFQYKKALDACLMVRVVERSVLSSPEQKNLACSSLFKNTLCSKLPRGHWNV